MKENYSEQLRDVIEYSREEAGRLQNSYIGPEHLMLGIIREGECHAYQILEGLHINPFTLKRLIEQEIKNTVDMDYSSQEITVSKSTQKVLQESISESVMLHSNKIGTEHLLLAILKEENIASRFLNDSGVTYEMVLEEIKSNRGDGSSLFQDLQEQEIEDGFTDDDEDEDDEDDFQKGRSAQHSSCLSLIHI